MSKWRVVGVLVAVVAVVAAYVGFVRPRGGPAQGAAPGAASSPSTGSAPAAAPLSPDQKRQAYDTEVKALQQRVARVQAFVDSFPPELLDIGALARSLASADAAFTYVRDRIAMEPYPGVMKGAAGTLESRGGNSIDRALLLAAILKQQGVAARIARGKLPAERAQALIAQMAASEDATQLIARSTAGKPPAASEGAQQAFEPVRARAETRAQAMRGEADLQAQAIRAALDKAGAPGPADGAAQQVEVLQDHFWVQATIDGRAVDLDPSFRDAQAGQAPTGAVQTFEANRVPDNLHQQITISVTAEFLNDGRLSSREVMRKQARAVDLIGRNIRLALEPRPLRPDSNDYAATIFVGNDRPVSGMFQLRPVKAASQSSSGGVGSMFGGALSGGAAQPEKTAKPEGAAGGERLGRLSVGVVIAAPQAGVARYRRVIVDRLERAGDRVQLQAGSDNDNTVRILLAQVWDGAISVGAIHPLRMFAAELDRLKAQQAMAERALAAKYLGQEFGVKDLAESRLPGALVNYFFYAGLAHHFVMRSEAPHARQYNLRPQLAFLRQGFAVHDWSKPNESRRFQAGLDVVNAPYAFVGNAEEAAKVGVKLGVAATALERSFSRAGMDFNTVPLMAAALGQKIPIVTVRPGDASAIDGLQIPPAIREVLRDELAQGQTLLLPAGLVALNGVRTFGWWSLDASGGVALGKMDLGAGQGLTESVKLRNAVNELTHIIAKFYGGLIGCYMMEIADQLSPPDGPYEVLKLPGLPAISGGKPLGECVASKVCEAIVELTILAISAAEYGHFDMEEAAKEMIEELIEMVAKIWLAEEGGVIGCSRLEGEGGHG